MEIPIGLKTLKSENFAQKISFPVQKNNIFLRFRQGGFCSPYPLDTLLSISIIILNNQGHWRYLENFGTIQKYSQQNFYYSLFIGGGVSAAASAQFFALSAARLPLDIFSPSSYSFYYLFLVKFNVTNFGTVILFWDA